MAALICFDPRDDFQLSASAQPDFAGGRLALHYELRGRCPQVVLPAPSPRPARRDELWKHTCFEAFVADLGGPGYRELNLSPSGDWNAYAFAAYREGMRPLEGARRLSLECRRSDNRIELVAALALPELRPGMPLALTAVIELVNGEKTYWSLRHPGPQADFHHPGGFTLTL